MEHDPVQGDCGVKVMNPVCTNSRSVCFRECVYVYSRLYQLDLEVQSSAKVCIPLIFRTQRVADLKAAQRTLGQLEHQGWT